MEKIDADILQIAEEVIGRCSAKKCVLRPATLLKKRLRLWCFPVNFVKFLRTLFLQNTFGGCFSNCKEVELKMNLHTSRIIFQNDSSYKCQFCTKLRSSCLEEFCIKGFLRNFAKFTGKHLCQSLFVNKVAGLGPIKFL